MNHPDKFTGDAQQRPLSCFTPHSTIDENHFNILLIVGPTASGKTTLGIELAKILSGEIISADSRQIYRHLNIGTAKPTEDELVQAVHHQIDIVEPMENFDASMFANSSDAIIENLWNNGKLPIVVGGSGFYIKALIDGLFEAPPVDESLRKKLSKESNQVLHTRLTSVDEEAAQRININDKKRIIRALEIYELTGKPMTVLHEEHQKNARKKYSPIFIGLKWDREQLYQRIEKRVDEMVKIGLFSEVKNLLIKYSEDLNSLQTVGYQEVMPYLTGEYSQDEAINLIKRNTRRYAKRQMTWFRKENRINWIDVTDLELSEIMRKSLMIITNFNKGT